ncbi:MAG: glycogen debranching protein GlgX [Rhodobacteraceae bacterium]|nr:glycogen debranching protein GlgX [Paracoccaceae bacterium]MCY4197164.1 glycogen debranching protein GlgX [Paracoccaceae bacterium]
MKRLAITSGRFDRLGAHHDGGGVNFAVFSENATRIELCLFSDDGSEEISRMPLPERTGPVWHGYVEGLEIGTLYGYRVDGPYTPEAGHRFNSNKLLIDPYTREFFGQWKNHPDILGYDLASPQLDLSFSPADSAPHVPKSVVSDPDLFSGGRCGLHRRGARDLIYEAHVKGLTRQHPDVPDRLRGTYEGLTCDSIIDHLHALGVQAIELMPVHAFVDDSFLLDRGLKNYWGYNSIGFFAPEPRYFGPAGLIGFRRMVERFHEADIEVILDVVYNHTAEGDHRGPTLSFRGFDNACYYRLLSGQKRYYVVDTGCGNTLNVSHPFVLRMVLDSLRFWVDTMGVDGFRFDLATTLGREDHGFDPNGGFFDALRQDPVLARVRMIAEPWDIGPGGYQLGAFPTEFSEWNDRYRDTVRRYWRGDEHSTQELGARLLGSADMFDHKGRRSWVSVNFVAAHDGFTLADTTSYAHKHNNANQEANHDGHNANFSDNCGIEGVIEDTRIIAIRKRRIRNLLATLFLSQGTPMLLAGDELGNSQFGNNNAYCQDNETSWIDWKEMDSELLDFVSQLAAFRRAHPAVRQSRFLHGHRHPENSQKDVEWTDLSGRPLQWRDPGLSNFCLTVRYTGADEESDEVFIAFNRSAMRQEVTLPLLTGPGSWRRCLDTDQTGTIAGDHAESRLAPIAGDSVVAFVVEGEHNSE